MDQNKTLLVVVDVQNGFVREGRSDYVVPVITELVQRWQDAGGSTLFTRYFNYPDSPYERLIGWRKMMSGPGVELVDDLKPLVGTSPVLDKSIYSIFTDDATTILNRGAWTDLLICGIATESCVLKSAIDAFERGLVPWVLTDACASHGGDEAHQAGLLATSRNIGRNQMITTASVDTKVGAVA